jgi:hypothetical protein
MTAPIAACIPKALANTSTLRQAFTLPAISMGKRRVRMT